VPPKLRQKTVARLISRFKISFDTCKEENCRVKCQRQFRIENFSAPPSVGPESRPDEYFVRRQVPTMGTAMNQIDRRL